MTLEQIQALTDDEIRVKVAEICGWQYTGPDDMRHVAFACWHAPSADPWQTCEPPNYPADLNACAEMEQSIPINDRRKYRRILSGQCTPALAAIHAHARQRCEAFLATMGKGTP